MVSDITIPPSQLQRTSSLYDVKAVQSTKKGAPREALPVGRVITDTVSLSSPDFLEKITQIQGFLEQISYGESVISTTSDHVETIVSKLEEAGGIAVRARSVSGSSIDPHLLTPQLEELTEKFIALFQDIDNLAENSGFPDENLLAGDTVSFVIDPSDGSKLDVEGVVVSRAQFGLEDVSFQTPEEAEYSKNLVLQALDQVGFLRSQLRASSYELATRKGFSENTIEVFLNEAQREGKGDETESDALRRLQSRLEGQAHEPLALETQFELLENFK